MSKGSVALNLVKFARCFLLSPCYSAVLLCRDSNIGSKGVGGGASILSWFSGVRWGGAATARAAAGAVVVATVVSWTLDAACKC